MGLTDEQAARVPDLDADCVSSAMALIEGERMLRWMFVQRGFWTNGAKDLPSYVAEMLRWKLDPDLVAAIRTPTLVTSADGDRASTNAVELFDALTCPKAHIHFTEADGADQHCAVLNRSFANRRMPSPPGARPRWPDLVSVASAGVVRLLRSVRLPVAADLDA
ncbi:MAG: hypothetical protein ACK5O2_08755 [Microthrixaceae bacterium]